MRGSTRLWPVAVAACLVLAGCGGADLAKQHFPRSTVPATQGLGGGPTPSSAPPEPGQGFTSEALRRVDPCGLMDEETLDSLGEPAENRHRDYSVCSNYMKDTEGRDLNFTLTLGNALNERGGDGATTIGGLAVVESELDDKTACFVSVVTEADPVRGITVQVGGDEPGGLCEPGRAVLEAAVARLRDDPPRLRLAGPTLAEVQPCAALDPAAVAEQFGESADKRPSGLHMCNWNARGVSLALAFRLGISPDETSPNAPAVDLGGGAVARQEAPADGGRCRLEWAHVAVPGDSGRAEVVTVDFDRYTPKAGEDVCAKAQALAKAIVQKLPAR